MKKWKDDLYVAIFRAYFWIFFICLIGGISIFWIGFHNFDSGHNLNYINAITKGDFVDYYSGTEYKTQYEMIADGVHQMITGFFVSLIAIFEIPMTLWLISSKEKKVKRGG